MSADEKNENASDDENQDSPEKGKVEKRPARKSKLSTSRKWLFTVIVLISFFVVTESILALFGVKRLRDKFDVSFGMSPHDALFEQRGPNFVTRNNKSAFFQHQSFQANKPDGTIRVFCLGGSTTFGRPYADRESYVGIVRQCLQEDSDHRWEVVNCGGVSYASYRLAVLAEELKDYSPDLLIVYTGHNEFLEERTFGEIRSRWQPVNSFLQIVSYSRVAGLFDFSSKRKNDRPTDPLLEEEVRTILEDSIGPEDYHRDLELVDNVVAQYRRSLEDILGHAESCGAKLILVEPADNLRFSPFKSEHGDVSQSIQNQIADSLNSIRELPDEQLTDLHVKQLQELVKLDPLYADSHFHLARAYSNAGENEKAYQSFLAARENDVCPLRAIEALHSELNDFAKSNDIPIIDYPSLIEKHRQAIGSDLVPGNQEFFDHVHPRTEMHGLLAGEIIKQLQQVGMLKSENCLAVLDKVLERAKGKLNSLDHAKALSNLAQVLSWSGKDKEGLVLAKNAYELAPHSVWIACRYGRMLEKNDFDVEAEKVFTDAVRVEPNHSLANFRLGTIKYRKGELVEAYRFAQLSAENLPAQAPMSLKQDIGKLLTLCEKALNIEPK